MKSGHYLQAMSGFDFGGCVAAATRSGAAAMSFTCVVHRSLLHSGGVALPYKISTLLYCFNAGGDVLLIERAQEPNRGLWSPPGGKLKTDLGESPYACACREAHEELGLALAPTDLQLAGIVSEYGYVGQAHWLMFLFEVKPRLRAVPPPMDEGRFAFCSREALAGLGLPQTDRERIWPLFWRHRGGFFAAHCHCHPDGRNDWTIEESWGESPASLSPACNS